MRALAALTFIGLLTVACGDDDEGAATAATTTTAGDTTDTTGAPADVTTTLAPSTGSGSDSVVVEVASSTLGDVLTSGGRTLYIFTPDATGPPTCTGDCATTWPPLLGDEPTAGEGVDAGLLATVEGEDGGAQVTVAGRPVYFFANDAAAGDVNGQGVGDVWFAVGPDGEPLEATIQGLRGY